LPGAARPRPGAAKASRRARVRSLAEEVGIAAAQLDRYPRELSGGQRQRVGLARALAANPALIVADEPVSALDVSVRSQILNLMTDLQAEHRLTYLMVSHDLTVIHYFADQIAVMYLGKFVESGTPQGSAAAAGCRPSCCTWTSACAANPARLAAEVAVGGSRG
jgi:peptide/nickel transport system ATP-binding protein